MVRVTFRVFGKDGHRQRASFGESFEFSTVDGSTHIECICEDRTLTNRFVEVLITADSFRRCADEFNAQLSDGIFEQCAVGEILLRDVEKKIDGGFVSITKEIDELIKTINL